MEIALAEGDWPGQIVLELELNMLEHLHVDNGHARLESALGRARPTLKWPASDELTMPITKKEGFIEVVLPPALYPKGTAKLSVDWIDAYR